jgi:hypothetical protein
MRSGRGDGLRVWACCVALLALAACASTSASHTAGTSPTSELAATPSAQSAGPGIEIALKATATISFQSSGFSRQYQLASGSNLANSLDLESHQAFLDLGSSSTQELRVTVVGGGAPGVTLQGPREVLASFEDTVARVGGIATVGQGSCTLMLTRFGSDGMAGSLDCQNVAPSLGSASPVSLQASLDAVPA